MKAWSVVLIGLLGLTIAAAAEDPESVGRTTVFIQTSTMKGTISGTGFLLADNREVCLVTAAHVASTTRANTSITLLSAGKPVSILLADLAGSPTPNWHVHNQSDVAAVRVRIPSTMKLHAFQRKQVLTKGVLPPRERPVMVFGFPLGLGARGFSPLSQKYSRVSDLVVLKIDQGQSNGEYYLVDGPSIEGYSGAPLFHVPGQFSRGSALVFRRDFALVGLFSGTVSDKTSGKLGAVVPPRYIAEMFDQAIQGR